LTRPEKGRARRLLCGLQDAIREALLEARRKGARGFSRVAGVTAADTIYGVDRIGEEAILDWFAHHWPAAWPVELVMEGLENEETVFPAGTPVERTRFKCIIDPIDGTRNLMYDKRPAWVLSGLAPQRGIRTTLEDIEVAVMTELPTSKQGWADQFSAIRGAGPQGVVATSLNLASRKRRRFVPRPSGARGFRHGFASLVKFFPDGKALTAHIEEALWTALHGQTAQGSPVVFDDQYLSSGGQVYELLVGHDRMVGDLRPLVFAKLGLGHALACHPYDLCTALVLTEAGGVVEYPGGGPIQAPLDTTTPVAWTGYANQVLARQVRPILRRLIREHLTVPLDRLP